MSEGRVLVDTGAAAAAVSRPESTIRRWGHEGRITRQGSDGRRRLWDLSDVYRAEAAAAGNTPSDGASSEVSA